MNSTPATFAVQPGTEVLVGERRAIVTRILDLDAVLVCDNETGQVRQARLTELQPAMPNNAPASPGLEELADEDWQTAQRRLDIIRPLVRKRGRTRAEVGQRARKFDLHPNTLYKWLTTYEATGRLTALIPKPRRDKGALRLSAEVEAVVQASIEDVYMTSQCKPVSRICDDVRRRCLNAGLEPPHANTIRNHLIKDFPSPPAWYLSIIEPLNRGRRQT